MSKHALSTGFAQRLHQAMISAGFTSTRSKSGVCMHTLTQLTNHSRQICRKYLGGETLPEPHVVIKIATALNVSPGWLLFGDAPVTQTDNICISKSLLHYILTHELTPSHYQNLQYPYFLMHLIHEITQLQGNELHLKKIIDLAFTSINQFRATTQAETSV
jgi:hypothetical protein